MPSGGRPASSRISTSVSAESGVSLAGLRITALPAASAGPTLWQTRLSGKLNGVIAATTPHGTRSVKPSLPAPPGAPSSGSTSPPSRLASSAESSIVSAARLTSKVAFGQRLAFLQADRLGQLLAAGEHHVGRTAEDAETARSPWSRRIAAAPSTAPAMARYRHPRPSPAARWRSSRRRKDCEPRTAPARGPLAVDVHSMGRLVKRGNRGYRQLVNRPRESTPAAGLAAAQT